MIVLFTEFVNVFHQSLNKISVFQVRGTKYMAVHTILANFYAIKRKVNINPEFHFG